MSAENCITRGYGLTQTELDRLSVELDPSKMVRAEYAGARFAVPREPSPPLGPPTPEQVAAYRRLRGRTIETRVVGPADDVRPDHVVGVG